MTTAEYIRQVVDKAPELTPEQIARTREVIVAGNATAATHRNVAAATRGRGGSRDAVGTFST
jgi:hypothetical protein